MLLQIPVEISDEQQLKTKSVQRCELMQIQTRRHIWRQTRVCKL